MNSHTKWSEYYWYVFMIPIELLSLRHFYCLTILIFLSLLVFCWFFPMRTSTNSSYKYYSKITSFSLLSSIFVCCVNDLRFRVRLCAISMELSNVTDGVCLFVKWDWTYNNNKKRRIWRMHIACRKCKSSKEQKQIDEASL